MLWRGIPFLYDTAWIDANGITRVRGHLLRPPDGVLAIHDDECSSLRLEEIEEKAAVMQGRCEIEVLAAGTMRDVAVSMS